MNLNRVSLWTLMLALLLMLAGCGGGSGGETNTNTDAGDGITGYRVTYDGNGNTGGSVPVDANAYADAQYVTVLGNPGALDRDDYSFAGWNTQADGNGSNYVQDSQFVMDSSDLTLYAKWSANPTYTVTYDGNGSTGGRVPVDSVNHEEGSTITVLGNSGDLVNLGYGFTGWNTAADGSGSSYVQGNSLTVGASNVTLYAQWSANPTDRVSYDGNGNTGGSVPIDSTQYEESVLVTVLDNVNSLSRSGYSFAGWNTESDGNGSAYTAGDQFVMGVSDVVLYAQWSANPGYSVSYDGNGNTGGSVPASANYVQDDTVTVSGNTGSLVRSNYDFSGWNTAANGSGTRYTSGDTFSMGTADVTLYAQWTAQVSTIDELVPAGYEGSIPARQLDSSDRQRLQRIGLQDLYDHSSGRYGVLSDDGDFSTWGLDQVAARSSADSKPYSSLRDAEGIYQSERVIFADLTTGAMMMKLTNQPASDGGDELNYFGKSAFSGDGSRMVWTRVDETFKFGPTAQTIGEIYGVLLMDADGSKPSIGFDRGSQIESVITRPGAAQNGLAVYNDTLVELDLQNGSVLRTIDSSWGDNWHLKASPDGQYVVDASNSRNIYVHSLTSDDEWTIPLSGAIHDSYQFVPGNTDLIMFWYESNGATQTELVNFKTQTQQSIDVAFDWNHGDVGRYYGVHESGSLYQWASGTWTDLDEGFNWPQTGWSDNGPWYDDPIQNESYLAHWPDDQPWASVTRIFSGSDLSEISAVHVVPTDGGGRHNRYRICLTNLNWTSDSDLSQTIDRPNISPDGTKLLFNSNAFGAYSQSHVYMVVMAKPAPPVNIAASWVSSGARITWTAPTYNNEIAGYHIYRSSESGRGMVQITASPVSGTSFIDTSAPSGEALFYAVRSVERSKLESELSTEVAVSSNSSLLANVPFRLYFEAEDVLSSSLDDPAPDGLWRNIDGLASNNHFLWQRRGDTTGSASMQVSIPRTDDYYVYARIKGARNFSTGNMYSSNVAISVAGAEVTATASDEWQWVRSVSSVSLTAGRQSINISASTLGSSIDAFYLSTDDGFTPEGRYLALPPSQLTISGATDSGHPRLNWTASNHPRFYYYNLYASDSPNFSVGRDTLIASPDTNTYLDWQAPSNQYYRVTQVTMDGLESAPSAAIQVQ